MISITLVLTDVAARPGGFLRPDLGLSATCQADGVVHAEIFFDPQSAPHAASLWKFSSKASSRRCTTARQSLASHGGLSRTFLRHLTEQDAIDTSAERWNPYISNFHGFGSIPAGRSSAVEIPAVFAENHSVGLPVVAHAGHRSHQRSTSPYGPTSSRHPLNQRPGAGVTPRPRKCH